MHEPPARHLPVAAIVVTMVVAAMILLYRSGLIAGMTAAFGSTTIVLIVVSHLGVLVAIGGSLANLRRLPRRNRRK